MARTRIPSLLARRTGTDRGGGEREAAKLVAIALGGRGGRQPPTKASTRGDNDQPRWELTWDEERHADDRGRATTARDGVSPPPPHRRAATRLNRREASCDRDRALTRWSHSGGGVEGMSSPESSCYTYEGGD
ncbi:hypothetical protein NDU88_005378 [Pleurodeles waltl]|uniref:Uncharacterized protein n=1 Tax=Pleurodeles waltl TaxID=8319 RepID=A0AAV7QH19_PLEWA|nr:hypothetical protein NDU88_005378 [Pleurodeles waltl]